MNILRKKFWPAFLMVFAAGLIFLPASSGAADEPVLVGRIAFVEGQVLRYVPDTQDWVATVKDAPYGMNDALYSDQDSKGEFIMPNGLWIRIGGSTQIQLIALKADAGELDIASGVARFYNKSSDTVLKVTTPFGYVLADPDSYFDLYVGDQSVEVIALDGTVDFINQADQKIEVIPGSGSIIADEKQVVSGEGTVDAEWDDWNATRDSLWTKRLVKGESTTYLPPQLQDDAYDLEENGTWERVQYEGEYRNLWTPSRVESNWQPFSQGRWTEYYGDQCWVPAEPFGYVTHHYGNWVIVNGRWFWAPPVATVAVATGPVIGFGWYPGRVAWISSGVNVGWVPLAPQEPYYAHHHWGPRVTVVAATAAFPVVSIGSLAFVNRAIIVPQAQLYSAPSYTSIRITNIQRTTIINNYHAAPIVQRAVPNYNQFANRHTFVNRAVTQKPHQMVNQRIARNQQLAAREARTINATAMRRSATQATTIRPAAQTAAAVQPPRRVTNRIVPANQVNAPGNQVNFKRAEMKSNTKAPTAPPAGIQRQGRPGAQPGVGRPDRPGRPGAQPGVTAPDRPGRPGRPGADDQPGRQGLRPGADDTRPGRPGAQPGITAPDRPGRPGAQPGVTAPDRPGRPGRPGADDQPGRQGLRPGADDTRPGRPGAQPGITAPDRPGRPGVQPGVTAPDRPGRPGRPGADDQPGRQGLRPGADGTRPGRPGAQPGITAPDRPGRPGAQPGVTAPDRPGRQQAPAVRPGTEDTRPGRPGAQPGTTAPGRRQMQQEGRQSPQEQQRQQPAMQQQQRMQQQPAAMQQQRQQAQQQQQQRLQQQQQQQAQQQQRMQQQQQRQQAQQQQQQRLQQQQQQQAQQQQRMQQQQQRQAQQQQQQRQQQQRKKPGEPGYIPNQ